jgi:hypothetical protein
LTGRDRRIRTRQLSIAPEVRCDYGSIGDEINNTLRGLQVLGVLGIVLGPVVFTIAAAILDVLREQTIPSSGADAPLP